MTGMSGWMPQRPPPRPQMGPSPMTAGRPNPMAGFLGGGASQPMAPPPQQWGGSFGTGKLGPMGPQGPMGGAPGPGAQGVAPNFGRFQGTPPWMGGGGPQGMMGQFVPGAGPAGLNDPNLQPQVASMGGGPQGMDADVTGQMQNYLNRMVGGAMGGGPTGMSADMTPQQLQGMIGQAGGGMRPQRRFPGALGRGIMQAMAPPPQAAPPAPYGGQQFRMW